MLTASCTTEKQEKYSLKTSLQYMEPKMDGLTNSASVARCRVQGRCSIGPGIDDEKAAPGAYPTTTTTGPIS
jgi:hypothetical protein